MIRWLVFYTTSAFTARDLENTQGKLERHTFVNILLQLAVHRVGEKWDDSCEFMKQFILLSFLKILTEDIFSTDFQTEQKGAERKRETSM